MDLLVLILRNVFRHKLRSFLTIVGVAAAMFSFCMLRTLVAAWYAGVDAASPDRLVTRNKISLTQPLPLAYGKKIRQVSGVVGVAPGLWYGGIYKDKRNFFPQFGVSGSDYLDLYPEYLLSKAEKERFDRERNACVVGRKLAKRFGWKIGQRIVIKGAIFPVDLDLVLRGIYRGARENSDETLLFFRFDYLNEMLRRLAPHRADRPGWFIVKIKDPDRAAEIAHEIDGIFENSLAETLTETEKAFQMGFVAMSNAIVASIKVISVVVICIILIVLANTMAMTARERSAEYAVLKTLGFSFWFIFKLISGESIAIALMGGVAAVLLSFPGSRVFHSYLESFLPVFRVEPSTLAMAMAASLLVGLLAAIPPIVRVSRASIPEGLRHLG